MSAYRWKKALKKEFLRGLGQIATSENELWGSFLKPLFRFQIGTLRLSDGRIWTWERSKTGRISDLGSSRFLLTSFRAQGCWSGGLQGVVGGLCCDGQDASCSSCRLCMRYSKMAMPAKKSHLSNSPVGHRTVESSMWPLPSASVGEPRHQV